MCIRDSLGITEAGSYRAGTVKSSIGVGMLLSEGIGDTIRISLASDPVDEVKVGWDILRSLKIRARGINFIACPSCSRMNFDVIGTMNQLESRLEDIKENIDVLTLTATPIPRTMNMVYAGLKDFSFIQTPPSNRVNIKSFLKIQSSQLLKEALSREKSRNGQCFILQNDISKMDSLKKEINKLLPDYKVVIAHGKQNKKEITKKIKLGRLETSSDFKEKDSKEKTKGGEG